MSDRLCRGNSEKRGGARLIRLPLVLACAALVLAGCGGKAAVRPPTTPTPRATAAPTATPIPSDVAAWAAIADPLLKSSIAKGRTLLSEMDTSDWGKLANDCPATGQRFESSKATLAATYTPYQAASVYSTASTGYRMAMGSTDECAIAADSSDRSKMDTASSDLSSAIDQLSSAQSTVSAWDKSAK